MELSLTMWFFQKPTEEKIRIFLACQTGESFSYSEIGASQGELPNGYDHDHNRVRLGDGPAVFEAACAALRRWAMFPRPWSEIHPANAPIEVGSMVVGLFHIFGVWWINPCRIVYLFDESKPIRRFGFAYGTLPAHVECGEERFSIEWEADGSVWYDIRAFSRPRFWMAHIGYPIVRYYQRRFVRESQASMQRTVLEFKPANSNLV